MSNVAELVQAIKDRMDYDPKLNAYRASILQRMNDFYRRFCGEQTWRWALREVDFPLYADVTSTTTTITAGGAGNVRRLLASAALFDASMEGAVFRAFYGHASIEEEVFRIARVESSTVAYLTSNWTNATTALSTTWRIEWQEYLLPEDCDDVVAVVDREQDRGVVGGIHRELDDRLLLQHTDKGEPVAHVEADIRRLPPPVEAPTAAAATTSGADLVAGRTYLYRYTFRSQGIESPPSPEVQVRLGGLNNSVNLSGLEDTRVAVAGTLSDRAGVQKWIYRRDQTGDGPWYHVGTLEDSATTFANTRRVPLDLYPTQADVRIWPGFNERKVRRFVWAPDSDLTLRLRYKMRPAPLHYGAQEPIIPEPHTSILTNAVLAELLPQAGDKTGGRICDLEVARIRDLLTKKQTEPSVALRRRRFDEDPAPRYGLTFGTPSKV